MGSQSTVPTFTLRQFSTCRSTAWMLSVNRRAEGLPMLRVCGQLSGLSKRSKRTLERCHCLARLRPISVGDFMHGPDALLMMLIQRFPAQGDQTGFQTAPMNDDCRTRMVAQQTHFLVGRNK